MTVSHAKFMLLTVKKLVHYITLRISVPESRCAGSTTILHNKKKKKRTKTKRCRVRVKVIECYYLRTHKYTILLGIRSC